MKCSSEKFSKCRGEVKKYKLIERYLIDAISAQSANNAFNVKEIKRVASEEVWFCDKHHKQHNAILEVAINYPHLLTRLSNKENIETIK